MRYFQATESSKTAEQLTGQDAREFVSVCLKQQYQDLVEKGATIRAYQLAYAGNIVTPDNSAVISFVNADRQHGLTGRLNEAALPGATSSFEPGAPRSSAAVDAVPQSTPKLYGATNGSVGAQACDATYVTGVNTAGTVRVNNLANLESLLNVVANCLELLGVVSGAALMIWSALARNGARFIPGIRLSRGSAAVLGIAMLLIGLAVPGTINWLVASGRDANLFE